MVVFAFALTMICVAAARCSPFGETETKWKLGPRVTTEYSIRPIICTPKTRPPTSEFMASSGAVIWT